MALEICHVLLPIVKWINKQKLKMAELYPFASGLYSVPCPGLRIDKNDKLGLAYLCLQQPERNVSNWGYLRTPSLPQLRTPTQRGESPGQRSPQPRFLFACFCFLRNSKSRLFIGNLWFLNIGASYICVGLWHWAQFSLKTLICDLWPNGFQALIFYIKSQTSPLSLEVKQCLCHTR